MTNITNKKRGQIYETVIFKTLNVKQQRTIIPKKWETNEIHLTISLTYFVYRL